MPTAVSTRWLQIASNLSTVVLMPASPPPPHDQRLVLKVLMYSVASPTMHSIGYMYVSTPRTSRWFVIRGRGGGGVASIKTAVGLSVAGASKLQLANEGPPLL